MKRQKAAPSYASDSLWYIANIEKVMKIKLIHILYDILRLYNMYKVCRCRLTEGIHINKTLESLRSSLIQIVKIKNEDRFMKIPTFNEFCIGQMLPHPLDVEGFKQPSNFDIDKISSEVVINYVLNKIDKDTKLAAKALKVVVFGVFDNSDYKNKRRFAYINIQELRMEYLRFNSLYYINQLKKDAFFQKTYYGLFDTSRKKALGLNMKVITSVEKDLNLYKPKTINGITETYGIGVEEWSDIYILINKIKTSKAKPSDVNVLIQSIQKINDTSPIGSLEFLDHLANETEFDSMVCSTSKSNEIPGINHMKKGITTDFKNIT
jgi:hypothetical protein